jgi:hypothetical protein
MKNPLALLACASLTWIASGAVLAQNPEGCASAKFSEQILERFPNAPDSCLDVISRGGQDYAVFRVQLERVSGNTLHVRFNNPDGSRGPRTRVTAQPDFRVLVEGQPTRVRDLAPNQELTAYVQVDRPMVALAPATATQTWHIVPLALTPAEGDAAETDRTRLAALDEGAVMPDTAGPAPIVATVGLLFILGAVGARAMRSVRSLRRKRLAQVPTT